MKRQIKFRAWDRDKKIMLQVNKLTLDAQFEAGWSFMKPYKVEKKYSNFSPLTNHVVLMQFTGLLDKNGNPVYEGDILSVPDTGWKYEVVWSDDRGGFGLRVPTAETVLDMTHLIQSYEIIGNIYESN